MEESEAIDGNERREEKKNLHDRVRGGEAERVRPAVMTPVAGRETICQLV